MVAGTANMVSGVVRFTLLEKELITLQVDPGGSGSLVYEPGIYEEGIYD